MLPEQQLEQATQQYAELMKQYEDPDVVSDRAKMRELGREAARLRPIVEAWGSFGALRTEIEGAEELLAEADDEEMKELARGELEELRAQSEALEAELTELLLPRDPNDDRDVIVEIRAGTGGDEAGLFAADLFRMYTRYAETQRWKVSVLSANDTGVGGLKEVIFEVRGQDVYAALKWESGVHRVQRVPQTETQGRIHTSTASVVVLPEAEEIDIEIPASDIRKDTFRSSGPGGQSVNTTDSAVRLTHLPTGIVVSCQDEKSQHQNLDKAMTILRSRLLDLEQAKRDEELGSARRSAIGSGDRSEKIRTYNFPQSRITDHRAGVTVHKLDAVMQGELGELLDAVKANVLAAQQDETTPG